MLTMLEKLPMNPCLVLAHPDPVYVAVTNRAFRRLGWSVYLAPTGEEARRLAHLFHADLVVLDVDLPEESGWLTCTKLLQERPEVKVLLVSAQCQPRDLEFASFVGAAGVVPRTEGVAPLLQLAREINLVPAA